jgi:hypothetical protein
MLRQLLTGFAISIINITIHALFMIVIVRASQIAATNKKWWPSVILVTVMIVTVSVLMIAHTAEVFVWSLAYWIVEAAPAGTNLGYFAFVNYTTLGYGDVIHVIAWQMLGPITAMNGMLLFGWSAAVIFEVVRRTMVRTNFVHNG